MKWELHAHCCETSLCGHVPAEELVKSYAGAGYTGLVLTDHYNAKTLDPMDGTDAEKVEKWLRGYELARAAGEKYGLRVLFGLEARLPINENDYLIFGATPEFLRAHPLLYRGTLPELHRLANDCGAIVVQAHPFREVCMPAAAEDLDGVECSTVIRATTAAIRWRWNSQRRIRISFALPAAIIIARRISRPAALKLTATFERPPIW